MKYSIIMPYIKRAGHLHNTLISYAYHYKNRDNYEVIIVEDPKNAEDAPEHELLLKVINDFKDRVPITHKVLEMENVCNPCCAWNLAARIAQGEFYLVTSPECFHWTNILGMADFLYKDYHSHDTTIVCATENRDGCNLFIDKMEDLGGVHTMWYQHTQHRNKLYPFCLIIHRDVWNSFGGFCEDFVHGFAYDDDDFVDSLLHTQKPIITRDDMMAIHINHGGFPYRGKPTTDNRELVFKRRRVRDAGN